MAKKWAVLLIGHLNNFNVQQKMKHHKHYYYPKVKNARLTARAQAGLDLLTALAIGISLAALLVAWWSA
jgi:hypothetical protein